MSGWYHLDNTLVIKRSNTVIRAYHHQNVHVTGGRRVPSTLFKAVTDAGILARLPAKAHAHVRVADLHALNITDYGSVGKYGSYLHRVSPLDVYYNGNPLHTARWPNEGFINIVDIPDGANGLRFGYNSSVPQSWHGESDQWVYGYWYSGSADRSIQVKSLDSSSKTVTLAEKPSHGLKIGHWGEQDAGSNKQGGYFRFDNILSALDQPGEYYMDRDSGKLYVWMPNRDGSIKSSDMVYISIINDCVRINSHLVNVHLEDFTLETCRKTGVIGGNLKRIKLLKMEIKNMGGVAVYFGPDTRDSQVWQCYIHDTDGGISIYGGDRNTLESSGNVISNNEIVRYSRVGALGNYAITVHGVGYTVGYNNIHSGQHVAIEYQGNDIVMEHNLIHDVCTTTSACGAIHTGYDWTSRGNIIRYNIIHHTLRQVPGSPNKAILLDGQSSGNTVLYNSLYDNDVHVTIHGGRDNDVVNNVLYNASTYSLELDSRGIHHYSDTQLLKHLHAVPYNSSVWGLRYPDLASFDLQNASLPEGNQITSNIIYAAPNTEYIHGIAGNHLLMGNTPKYYNITQTGFSLGSADHYSVSHRDLRVRCYAYAWANRINFKQPQSPNAVGPRYHPVGPTYLNRGRTHLVNTTYAHRPCTTHAPPTDPPLPSYLPDGSRKNDVYPVEKIGCWLNVTKCTGHPPAVGTYRDMYGERYHHAADNETMCHRRAVAQWKFCGSHKNEQVAAIFGPTGATTLGGDGCMMALYGCPKHGGPADGHVNTTSGRYQHQYNHEATRNESVCLSYALIMWHYCGSNPNYPVTNVYRPTGAKRTAGGGCWLYLERCPRRRQFKSTFYDAFGATNYQSDDSEFACLHQAEYYWNYCGKDHRYPVTATYRPTTATMTYP